MTTEELPAIKRSPGRPRLYNNCLDMAAEIELYFDECMVGQERERYDKKRQEVVKVIERIPPTIAGLCRHLGFEDRNALYEYEARDSSGHEGFSSVIKRARSQIEEVVSTGMLDNSLSTVGSIFYLKNVCGYRDQQEQTLNTGIQVIIDGQLLTSAIGSSQVAKAIEVVPSSSMIQVSIPADRTTNRTTHGNDAHDDKR